MFAKIAAVERDVRTKNGDKIFRIRRKVRGGRFCTVTYLGDMMNIS